MPSICCQTELTLSIEQQQKFLGEHLRRGQILHCFDDHIDWLFAELLIEGKYQGNDHIHQYLRIVALDNLQKEAGKVHTQIVCKMGMNYKYFRCNIS